MRPQVLARLPDVDEQRLDAWRAFLELHPRLLQRLEAELVEACGLPLSWYDVLLTLREAPGRRMRMQQLAARVALSQSGISRLVDRMADAGLVDRVPCPSDRRGRFVALTRAGAARLRAAAPVHLDGVARHFTDHLSEEEAALLTRTLGRIRRALDAPR